MTTITAAPPLAAHGASRIPAVFRLHFANPVTAFWMPLGIIAFIFAVNVAIWAIIRSVASPEDLEGMDAGTRWSGAAMFIFVWLLVAAIQMMNRTFHFALGFGATRRDFFLGTLLACVTMCAVWSVLFGTMALIEEATGGWGLSGHMFAANYFGTGPVARYWYVFLLTLTFTAIGLVAGALFVRWQTFGVIAFFAALVIVAIVVGGALIVSGTGASFIGFVWGLGFAGAYPLLLPVVAVFVALGYIALRRATARS